MAGEKINICGVSVAGYNGIGIYTISSVINSTTFQYEKFEAPIRTRRRFRRRRQRIAGQRGRRVYDAAQFRNLPNGHRHPLD